MLTLAQIALFLFIIGSHSMKTLFVGAIIVCLLRDRALQLCIYSHLCELSLSLLSIVAAVGDSPKISMIIYHYSYYIIYLSLQQRAIPN